MARFDRSPYHLETNVPGLFAAGDVLTARSQRCASAVGEGAMPVTFVHRYSKHWMTLASGSARVDGAFPT